MGSQKSKFFTSLAIACAILFFIVKTIWFSSVLVGEKFHDFGVVDVIPPNTSLYHVFVLKNESGRDLVLLDVVPDCGCTTTEEFQDVIPAGEELVLSVQLKLRQSRLRKSTLRLVFDDSTVEFLVLKAEGRVVHPLRISRSPIYLKPTGAVVRAIIETEEFDESRPATPQFSVPEGVEITSTKWKLKSKLKPQLKIPAIWSMELSLSSQRPMQSGDELIIVVDTEELHIPLEPFASSGEEDGSIRFVPVQ